MRTALTGRRPGLQPRRDHERGQGYCRIDRGIEEGIEVIVGEMPVAQCVDSTLPSIVAAEDEKFGTFCKPFLAQRAVGEERSDLGFSGRRVDDDECRAAGDRFWLARTAPAHIAAARSGTEWYRTGIFVPTREPPTD